jgi:FecR protein
MTPRRFASLLVVFAMALGLISVTLANAAPADETGLSYARIVRLSVVRGDVQIARGDSGKWEPAAMNMPLQQGFAVGTNEGLAEIELEHGSMIWVAPNSVVQFTELALSGGGQITKVAMTEGTATFDAAIGSEDVFSVSNQDFDITPAGKSEFRVDLTHDGVGVSVLKGKIAFHSSHGTENLGKGEMYFLGVRKPQQSGLHAVPKADEWDGFVKKREDYIDAAAAQNAQYTTAPFSYGMADLSAYGGWLFVPGMGYAWQPNGIGAGWMPFADGAMMFYDGFGWTWVSAEPWGWVPYHFGQWAYTSPYGWMWVPGNYSAYSAAPVNWVSVGNKVGWTPLSNVKSAPESKMPMLVVANHGLNNPYSYKVVSSLKQGQAVADLAAAPGANGKLGTTSELRLVAPTAAKLAALHGNLQAEAKAIDSRPAIGRPPVQASDLARAFGAQNGMPESRLITSHPPSRMMGGFGGEGMMGDASVRGSGSSLGSVSGLNGSSPVGAGHSASGGGHASGGGTR